MSIKSEDVKRVENESTGEAFIDARAQIKNIEPPTESSDAARKADVDGLSENALQLLQGEIDAMSGRMINLANAQLTSQGDAVNVGTMKSAFPDLMSVDAVTISLVTISIATITLPALQQMAADVSSAFNTLAGGLRTNHVVQ